ncbi:MAG: hypothetical protein ACFB15_26150 [Cyclobacteriaceae bacterium]
MKALIDKKTVATLQEYILGMEDGEITSALLLAMLGGVTDKQIPDMAIAQPT